MGNNPTTSPVKSERDLLARHFENALSDRCEESAEFAIETSLWCDWAMPPKQRVIPCITFL
jgi:hypothetical protein